MSGHAQDGTINSMYSDTATISGSPQASAFQRDTSQDEFPRTIPDPHAADRARTLVLCFDGTGDQLVQSHNFVYLESLCTISGLTRTYVKCPTYSIFSGF